MRQESSGRGGSTKRAVRVGALAALTLLAPLAGGAAPSAAQSVDAIRDAMATPYHGDLDGLLERGVIRVAVTYSKTHFFVEKGRQYGLAYENLMEFERFLRERHPRQHRKKPIAVVLMPVPRDELLPRLLDGRADLAVANLTITPERQEVADFTVPLFTEVRELLVTRAGAPRPATIEELSGREVVVRRSSSFREHLEELSARLVAAGRPPVQVVDADEHLETEDLLEMVNAGLIEATVADDHVVGVWEQIFKGIQVRPDLVLATGGSIAWAVRKDAPRLRREADAFLATHRAGTTFGNVLRQRYLQDPYWARQALDERELGRFRALLDLFQRYGDRYRFDHLLLLAQAFQESGLDQQCRSPSGAVGVMQVLPETGALMRVGDIKLLEPNVHAGAKYLRSLIDTYFSDPAIGDLDRVLFAFAAYNAGPTRVYELRQRAAAAGLDPNVWFGQVELIASQRLGPETVRYVSNISKYYMAYRMIENRRRERAAAH